AATAVCNGTSCLESDSASACAAAWAFWTWSSRTATGAGLTARLARRLPSLASQTRISPDQSAAITFVPSWLKTASSAISPKASNSRCLLPLESQTRTTRSRPVETSRPSLANRTDSTPPPWAPIDAMLPPFSSSQSLIEPSSLDEATTFESSRQETSVMAAVWPRRSKYSRPVGDSQITRPLLRSPVASNTPSGLNSTAVIHSVCFFISNINVPSAVL